MTTAQFSEFVADEIAKWAGPIKSSGLVLE